MDPNTVNLIVTGIVSLVIGWLARHKGIGPIGPQPSPAPVPSPSPVPPAQHPILANVEQALISLFRQWLASNPQLPVPAVAPAAPPHA